MHSTSTPAILPSAGRAFRAADDLARSVDSSMVGRVASVHLDHSPGDVSERTPRMSASVLRDVAKATQEALCLVYPGPSVAAYAVDE
jgi:hypothetical protein